MKVAEMEDMRQTYEQRLSDLQQSLSARHKEEMETLGKEHVTESQLMLREFQQVQSFLKNQLVIYEKRYN